MREKPGLRSTLSQPRMAAWRRLGERSIGSRPFAVRTHSHSGVVSDLGFTRLFTHYRSSAAFHNASDIPFCKVGELAGSRADPSKERHRQGMTSQSA